MIWFVFTVSALSLVLGDQCTEHVLTGGPHAGTHGLGCVNSGCCEFDLQIGELCAGSQICCFSRNTCPDTGSTGTVTSSGTGGDEECTQHELTGSHAGTYGIGCVDSGCCEHELQIGSLCAGTKVCCFSRDTCSNTGSSGGGGDLDCSNFGSNVHHARGTAYFPDSSPLEGGYVDMRGAKLRTLQDFLAGNADYVSVAMDNHAGIAYGTPLCIPEMNRAHNRVILFKVVDTGGAFYGKGYSRIDICVANAAASYDSTINGPLTLVFK